MIKEAALQMNKEIVQTAIEDVLDSLRRKDAWHELHELKG